MIRRAALITAIAIMATTAIAILLISRNREPAPSQAARLPVTLADDEGVTTTVSSAPRRLVVLAPHLTEFLFAIGAGPRVVGATSSESRPPEAQVLPSVTGADGVTPDPQKVKELRPDLVIVGGFQGAPFKEELRRGGVRVVTFNASGVEDALKDMESVGRLTASSSRAAPVLARIKERVSRVSRASRGKDTARVFVEAFYPPLAGVGPKGYTADLLTRAGGSVVAAPGAAEVFEWDLNQLKGADPDVYLAGSGTAGDIEALASRDGFSGLRAIRERRGHVVPDEVLFSPGPRIAESLERVFRLLHPDPI